MWFIFVPAAVGLVAAVGAGIAKRQKLGQATEQAAGAAAAQGSASTQGGGTYPGMPQTAPPTETAPTMTLDEVNTRVLQAAATGNPQIMRDMAAKIRAAGYPDQAAGLEQVASSIELLKAQTTGQTPTATTTGQAPPATGGAQVVDGSTWIYTRWNASTGYSYLTEPVTAKEWAVPASNVRANGTNVGTSQDFTISDGRIIRNPVKSPTFYTQGGIVQQQPPVQQPPVQQPPVQQPPVQQPPVQQPPVQQPPVQQPPVQQPPVQQPPVQQPPKMTMTEAATLVAQATASQDPAKMREAAIKLRAGGFADQAAVLEQAATIAEQLKKVPQVQQPPVQQPPVQQPPVQQPPVGANKPLADATVTAVLQQKKGTAAQITAVRNFQVAENLVKKDGQYGSETAKALADRYNIVPPQPLYWGPAKGTYAQYLADKKDYQSFLQKKAAANPPGTQWKTAASAIKLSGDEIGDEFEGDESPGRDKQLAAQVYLALRYARKKTPSEPRALVQKFQEREGLQRVDGSYNSETALALADRYGLVPHPPFYWGRENGSQDVARKDKAQYTAHMLVMADKDPQRADEWKNAAKV